MTGSKMTDEPTVINTIVRSAVNDGSAAHTFDETDPMS